MLTIHRTEKVALPGFAGQYYWANEGGDLAGSLELSCERIEDIPDILADFWFALHGEPAEFKVVSRPDSGSMVIMSPEGDRLQVQEWVRTCGGYWREWSETMDGHNTA